MDFNRDDVEDGFDKEFKNKPKRSRGSGKVPRWLLIAAAGILTTGLVVSGRGGRAGGVRNSLLSSGTQSDAAEISALLAENAPQGKTVEEPKKKASLSDFFSGIFGGKNVPTATAEPVSVTVNSAVTGGKLTEGDENDAPLYMEDDDPSAPPYPADAAAAAEPTRTPTATQVPTKTDVPTKTPQKPGSVPITVQGVPTATRPANVIIPQVITAPASSGKSPDDTVSEPAEDSSVYDDFSVYRPAQKWDDAPEEDGTAKNVLFEDIDPEAEAAAAVQPTAVKEIPTEVPQQPTEVPTEAPTQTPEPTPEPTKEGSWFSRFINTIFGGKEEPTPTPTAEVIISTAAPKALPTFTATAVPVLPTETVSAPVRLDATVVPDVVEGKGTEDGDPALFDDSDAEEDDAVSTASVPVRLTDEPTAAALPVSDDTGTGSGPEEGKPEESVSITLVPDKTEVPEELPETGAAGRWDTPALISALVVLLFIVVLARRLRRRE